MEDLVITTLLDEETGIITALSQLGPVEAVGSAKCMEEDTFEYDIGAQLAIGRSLQKLGKRLEKDAFREVHRRDDVRKNAILSAAVAKGRQQLAKYRWECEFAELINLELEKEEHDIVPEPYWGEKSSSSKKDKKKKPRGKAFQIRENLPA
jgi:hypothetical protein